MNEVNLKDALEARGIGAADLVELVHELAVEGKRGKAYGIAAAEAEAVTMQGLAAQLAWLAQYYQAQPTLIHIALAGFLACPILKEAA